jgi:hypothetical protein
LWIDVLVGSNTSTLDAVVSISKDDVGLDPPQTPHHRAIRFLLESPRLDYAWRLVPLSRVDHHHSATTLWSTRGKIFFDVPWFPRRTRPENKENHGELHVGSFLKSNRL